MTSKRLHIMLGGIVLAMFATVFGIFQGVHANPFFFAPSSKTATATTTLAYLTAGTATTTFACDSFSVDCTTTGASGSFRAYDKAALLVQFVASTTSSTLRVNIEYSQDNIDWYQEAGTLADGYATTSKPYDISQPLQYNLNFSSTTAGLATPGANSATTTRIINVKTPTRFVRAVFTLPVGSAAGGVWAHWVPIKQSN